MADQTSTMNHVLDGHRFRMKPLPKSKQQCLKSDVLLCRSSAIWFLMSVKPPSTRFLWVPKMLTEDYKRQRVEVAQKFLDCRETDGEEFLDSIVTGDETWVHYTTPETKEQYKQWKHTSSPKPLKFKQTFFCRETYGYRLLGPKGPIVGTTINSNRYCETLKQLLRAIQNKRRGMLTKGVRFHHDNARPHTASQTTALIGEFGWELVSHPPYSSDVAPSDFHLFPELKKNLGGTQFQDDDKLEEAVLGFYAARRQSSLTLGSISGCPECKNASNETGNMWKNFKSLMFSRIGLASKCVQDKKVAETYPARKASRQARPEMQREKPKVEMERAAATPHHPRTFTIWTCCTRNLEINTHTAGASVKNLHR
ncbi:hypothetical protein LAZ67_6003100 [Cordylochernes scorpioides]|uniref:Transposase n=1 Tax=Cordylochernes scorpioides TaxID=51811 RepID=A0ABY6KKA0_9ARAC|nr:hypothetical protein LAZ67_6003100 [Cordylochernes scorpioides]